MKKSVVVIILFLVAVAAAFLYKMLPSLREWIISKQFASHLPFLLIGTVSVILLVVAAVFFILYSSQKRSVIQASDSNTSLNGFLNQNQPEEVNGSPCPYSKISLMRNFSRAIKLLRANTSVKDCLYHIPWFLLVGESGTGKTTALENSGLNLPLGQPVGSDSGVKEACNFWFFENGAILDVAGDLVLGQDGISSDQKVWRFLLRLLQKHRPKRPVDGLILTIPCTDLVKLDSHDDAAMNKLAQKASLLYQKLWDAQITLGMRFPVYIIITKCDHIQGFKKFCRSMPDYVSDQIFGWSTPYGIDTAYSSKWPEEAMEAVQANLEKAQYEIFAGKIVSEDCEGIFQFVSNFKQISNAIQLVLNRIFKQSAYHESFIFRGLYFTGDSSSSTMVDHSVNPIFLKEFFTRKVFPEFKLAKPLRKILVSRNRKVRFLQATVAAMLVLGALGFWNAYGKLRADKNAMVPVLEEIGKDVQKLKSLNKGNESQELDVLSSESAAVSEFEETALNLFKGMVNIKDPTYLFIPSSWFSKLHYQIEQSMVYAYDNVILKSMYIRLHQKAKAVFDPNPFKADGGDGNDAVIAIEETTEFKNLEKFINNLQELEINAKLYNGLRTSNDVEKDLGHVVKYLYGIDLPVEFYKNARSYHKAISETDYRFFDPSIIHNKTNYLVFKKLIDEFYDRIINANVIRAYIQLLALQLENFSSQSRSTEKDAELIQSLMETITRAENALSDGRLAWLFNDTLDLGGLFENILANIEQSNFLGPSVRREVEESGIELFSNIKEELRLRHTTVTGPVLKRDNGKILSELSSGVIALKDDLDKLLNQEFMIYEAFDFEVAFIEPGTRLRWNNSLLTEAVELFKPYKMFKKNSLKKFPLNIQKNISNVAKDNLQKRVMDLVFRAQSIERISSQSDDVLSEAEAAAEINNFKECSDSLKSLMKSLDQMDLSHPYQILKDALYWQTTTLLTTFDALLNTQALYTPKRGDFSWWNGENPISLEGFDVMDQEELKHYLMLQRRRVKHIAEQYAEPLLDFLKDTDLLRNPSEENKLFRWQRIIEELDKYENKKPENSVTTLENFILFEMNKMTPENYSQLILKNRLTEGSGDFFLQQRNNIRKLIFDRCLKISEENAFTWYGNIKNFFDKKLSGKFPFSSIQKGKPGPEAAPEDIRDFYFIFDKQAKHVVHVLDQSSGFGPGARHAIEFLNQMEAVRELFTNYVGEIQQQENKNKKQKTSLPEMDITVDLRANRKHEIGANRIIDWELAVGDQVFRYGSSKHSGRWQFGEPVKLKLRWAADGNFRPMSAGNQAGVSVENQTAVFNFDNQWSLLRMIGLHAATAGDLDHGTDPEPHTLAFHIETTQKEHDVKAAYKYWTKVFIRIAVGDKDKSGYGSTMPVFPKRAPSLITMVGGKY